MKNIIIILVVLCCCLSCAKKEVVPTPVANNLSLQTNANVRGEPPTLTDGRWVFASEEHFDDFINYLDGVDMDEWETNNEFVSYRTTYLSGLSENEKRDLQEMPINDASLATLLNENGIVQVSPWIFKLNPTNRTVYALHTNYIADIEQLNSEIPQGTHIREFSFDDEVFDMVAEFTAGKNEVQCAGGATAGTSGWNNYCANFKYCVNLHYQSWGITKKIDTEFKHRHIGSGGNIDYTNFAVEWDYDWTQKNGTSETGINSVIFILDNATGQILRPTYTFLDKNWCKTFYHGTKCLTKFKTHVKVYFVDACQQNINTYIESANYEI